MASDFIDLQLINYSISFFFIIKFFIIIIIYNGKQSVALYFSIVIKYFSIIISLAKSNAFFSLN